MLGHGLGSWADLCDNFSFRVFIDNQEFGFSRVMNLEQDQEVEEFQVGGMNFAPHIAVTPNKKGGRLILVLSEFWVFQEKVDMKVSAFSFTTSLLVFGYL